MKKRVISVLTIALAAGAAHGATFHEPFATLGELNGQTATNGNVWAKAGGAAPLTHNVVEGSLSYPGYIASTGGRVQWSNNSALASGSRGSAYVTRLGIGEHTSGSVYWSALVRIDDISGLAGSQTTGVYVAGFNTTTGAQTGTITQAASRLVLRPVLDDNGDQTGQFNFGTSVNSNLSPIQVFESTPRSAGETYLIVGSYTFNPGSNDDVAQLWINPSAESFGADSAPAADLTSTGAADLTAIRTFFFRQYSDAVAQSPAAISADELRVDTSWAAVTAVPEPTSLAALALAGGMLRRRRSR